MEAQLCERTDLLKKPDLVRIYRFTQIQKYQRKIKFWTKSREREEEGRVFLSDRGDPLQNCACGYLSSQQESEKTQA